MSTGYKKLYEASKAEHERTWEKLRKANHRIKLEQMNYAGAMADLDQTVVTMRKHLLAMYQFLELNYPTDSNVDHTEGK